MSTTIATVQTLTAEIRVLMVGNRQITLSVFRQLDQAKLEDIEPFGRVNADEAAGPWVVGRRRSDGTLVRATYFEQGLPTVDVGMLPRLVTICTGLRKWDRYTYEVIFNGRTILVSDRAAIGCGKPHHGYTQSCESWYPNGMEPEIQDLIDKHDGEIAPHHLHAARLPLIVLAGLR